MNTMYNQHSFPKGMNADCTLSHSRQKPDIFLACMCQYLNDFMEEKKNETSSSHNFTQVTYEVRQTGKHIPMMFFCISKVDTVFACLDIQYRQLTENEGER